MSSKRRADRQITKDDRGLHGDNDEDSEQEVTFGITKASAEEIGARRIVRVKRTAPSVTNNTVDESKTGEEAKTADAEKEEDLDQQQKPSNPFASIQLTSSGGASTSVFGAPTGFRGFSSLGNNEKESSSSTIFGASSGFQGFGSVASSSSNGFGTDTQSSTAASAPTTFGGFASLSSSVPSNSFTFGSSKNNDDKTQPQGENDTNAPTSDANNTPSNAAVTLPEDYVLESGEEEYKLELQLRCKSYRWMKKVHVTETKQENSAPSVPSTELFTKSEKRAEKADSTAESNQNENASSKEQHTWVEQGVGPARILQIPNSNNAFARLTQRRQAEEGGKPTKLLINLLIGRESTADPHTDKVVRVSSVEFSDEGTKPVLFLFRFKDAESTTKFLDCLKKVIPQTKSFQQMEIANG